MTSGLTLSAYLSDIEKIQSKYLEALQGNSLPIVSSIGKQSTGKSYFLGKMPNDDSIENKNSQFCKRGTSLLFSKVYEEFLLLDMEDLEGDQVTVERDILNFASTFSTSDVLLLHITQLDLETNTLIDSFSYTFWHSTKISSKFSLRLPEIILLIRDPRISLESEKTLAFYRTIINDFTWL